MTSLSPSPAQVSMFDIPADPSIVPLSKEVVESRKEKFLAFFSSGLSDRNTDEETPREAIKRVYDNASSEWKTQATEILHQLCLDREEFTLDCVAEALKPIDHLPHEPRAVGQLMRTARKNRWCRLIRYENSKRKSRHYGIISVDESLLFSA